jgi:diguanylate cyclase (GGDEF)-like protein/PAS domain S-box-containing protein
MSTAVLFGAFVLHVVVGATAVRLALSSRRLWWGAVALAIVLMAIWRVTAAIEVVLLEAQPDLGIEVLAAVISVSMIVGMREAVRATTALRRSHTALRKSEDRYRAVAESATDAIVVLDERGRVIYTNPAVEAVFGYSPGDVFEHPFTLLAPDSEHLFERPTPSRGSARERVLELSGRHKDGRAIALEATFGEHQEDGAVTRTGILRDVTERELLRRRLRTSEERLIHDALHDGLTGLPNRAMLLDRLERCLMGYRRRGGPPCAVLFVDLDRFKNVNDSLGHAIGDRLLIAVARKLVRGVRPEDMVARLGGDEFAILLERLESRQAGIDIVHRLLASLAERVVLDEHELVATASIGFVWGDGDYACPDDLLRDADAAMYRAKALGKARCEIFDSQMHDVARTRLALEAELRRAVEKGAIEVAYQPIVSLATGRTSGFEALARWTLDGRAISPAQFIPIAEECELIADIELRMMHQALSDLAAMQRRFDGYGLGMNLNLSARHLRDPMLIERLKDTLARTSVAPGSVRLEITESFMLEDDARTTSILEELRELGFKLVIDDFGTGYSSLSYLHRLPIQCVKLDRSFVKEMESSERRATIVSAVVNLAKQLSLETVAEGVETSVQVERLRRMGLDFVQGYFFSAAVDAKSAEAFVAREVEVLGSSFRAEPSTGTRPVRRLVA